MAHTDQFAEIADLDLSTWHTEDRERIDAQLAFIADIDLSEPDYSFDLLRFYVRKADGVILYATDQGCSCPSPFEDTSVSELAETDLENVERVARNEAHADGYGAVSVNDVVQAVRALIPAMREAGAR